MLPKSLVKLGETARGPTKEAESWPPPILGTRSISEEGAQVGVEDSQPESDPSEEDESDEDDDDDVDGSSTPPTTPPSSESVKLSPSASRDIYALLSQLRSLTSRLTALESLVTKGAVSPSGVPVNRPWYSFSSSSSKDKTQAGAPGGADLMTLSASKLSLFMTIGSAAGAAVALAAVSAWGRRRM